MTGIDAGSLIRNVADAESFRRWDEPIVLDDRLPYEYLAALRGAQARTGIDEAVLTGKVSIDGMPVAVVATEFGFLGGSIGVDAADRLLSAVERDGGQLPARFPDTEEHSTISRQ